ncbi:beta-lactamase/transpeptidase-like protein [Xylogone sp. PMI_703]|nr:beta-lactamase/transpeptidase-like protein [Xylogone sp. PMI_703]
MLEILWLIGAATLVAATGRSQDCVLAGPDYPPSPSLSSSSLLATAILNFENLLINTTLGLQTGDTAWGVALFSSKENKTLYERYYTPSIDLGVAEVNRDSIFRIGSVSKVFSVWSFLIEVGDEHFNSPITKYVPELANLSHPLGINTQYNDLDSVRWEDVTLGELASHAAGIARDPTDNDLAAEYTTQQLEALGFPTLNQSEIPTCGVAGVTPACTRKAMFSYLLKQHPLYSTAHSPAYSNVAFTLLGYAQETLTGKSFNTTVTESIFNTLGMDHSSFEATPSSGGVIPGGIASKVGWDLDLGQTSPSGSVYSSTADMVKAGQAILQSTLLSPALTRRWLKPLIQTGYTSTAVGAPWEIRYLLSRNQRMFQLYTKQGDLGSYHAALVLSPEHDLGWVVLTAGTADSDAPSVRESLMNVFGDTFLPAAERQARDDAVLNFSGTYVDDATNSSAIILVGDDGRPGLGISSLVSHGVELIGLESPLIQVYGAGQSGRLYLSQLRTVSKKADGTGNYASRLGFRATFFNETQPGKVQDPCLDAWTALGAPLYGSVALDDWVFEMGEDGKAEALLVRIARLRLVRLH